MYVGIRYGQAVFVLIIRRPAHLSQSPYRNSSPKNRTPLNKLHENVELPAWKVQVQNALPETNCLPQF